MTKQDNAVGLFTFGGYPSRSPNQKHLLPDNKLLTFLNIDIKNEAAVKKFCTDYCFIPRDLTNGLYKGIVKEHSVFIPIAIKVLNHTATEADIVKINDELSGIRLQAKMLTYQITLNINDELLNKPKGEAKIFNDIKEFNQEQIDLNYRYPNTVADLYTSLIEKAKSLRPFRNCKQCGIFFTPSPRNPKQIFCTETCKDKYSWHRKKAK